MSAQSFADVIRDAILSLPQDMKAVLRIVEDPELDDDSRALAAGAILHVLSASNAIPGLRGTLAYVDDVIVLRLALERIEKSAPQVIARHRSESPELFSPLTDQMASIRRYLGDAISVLDKATDGLPKLSHQGHDARTCARDDDACTWLYDSVSEAIVDEFDFDDEEVSRAVKRVDEIIPHLQQRRA